jgi:hypothetical protein
MRDRFERVVLINLKRRPDRLARAMEELERCVWPFKEVEVFEAVDGDAIPHPETFQGGASAWGCLRSHQLVLERAILDGVKELLVLEDDVCFCENFTSKASAFLDAVPSDWDQLMIGGQHTNHFGPPESIGSSVYRCKSCERTHCYAIRGDFMRELYRRLVSAGKFGHETHCDWIMARDPEMQLQHKVYAPAVFLAGQRRDYSRRQGDARLRRFWNRQAVQRPVVLVRGPLEIASALMNSGFYFGRDVEPQKAINRRLEAIIAQTARDRNRQIEELTTLIKEMQWEAESSPHMRCALWHPDLTLEALSAASDGIVHEVAARSVAEALRQLPKAVRPSREGLIANEFVIHLKGPRAIMQAMRSYGWHNGFDTLPGSGYSREVDRAYRELLSRDQRIQLLGQAVTRLQAEARRLISGVAVVWHPNVPVDELREAVSDKIIELAPETIRTAVNVWEELVAGWLGGRRDDDQVVVRDEIIQ